MVLKKKKKTSTLSCMFQNGDIVKVLIPNVINAGYDYRLCGGAAQIGDLVRVTVMMRPYVGVIVGPGDSGLPPEKIKSVSEVLSMRLNPADLRWIMKMAEWTMMAPGAVLRLIFNVPDAFLPPRMEQLYALDLSGAGRMTDARQAVADAFASNAGEALSAADIVHIARVSSGVVRTMIKSGMLVPVVQQAVQSKIDVPTYHDTGTIELNVEQAAAAAAIGDAVHQGGFSVHLLDGVTGSGKTQV